MINSKGLRFEKFDLHVHTPASYDFNDKTVTPIQIVEEAISKGLKAIAITDHNTGEWVDKIIEAAEGKDLTIFPGVEIYCTGGEKGIHVIAILDVNKRTKHISAILSELKIDPDDFGKKKAVTNKSVYDVINVITSNPINGIAVLAHCTSSKGVLNEIKGETRTEIFKHPKLLAVESSFHDFTDADKIQKKTRAIDLLNGKDENFNFRHLGVYISSDSHVDGTEGHELKGIGTKYTYFKVDDSITLESLRQCFIDRDVRIRQYFELKTNIYPTIESIKISGGFFDNQNAIFHQGLNSILGAKGAGKSLLIEFLRFGLNKLSTQTEIAKDHNSKLSKKLLTYGKVEIEIIDETGIRHTVERTLNQPNGNPYSEKEQESIANSFNALFLSQNEIIKIAEDENEQINFIDSFFDFKYYKNKIKNIENDLSVYDDSLSDGLKAYSDVYEIQNQLNNLVKEKEKLDKLLADKIYDNYKKLEEKNNTILYQERVSREWLTEIEGYFSEFEKKLIPSFSEQDIKEDPVVKRNNDTLQEIINKTKNNISNSISEVKELIIKIENERNNWNKIFQQEKTNYETHIRNTGGDRKEQEGKRIKTLKEIEELNRRKILLDKKKENLKTIIDQRNAKMEELFKIYEEYSAERKNKCAKFEQDSAGKLKIHIHESTNFDEFKNNLLQLKRGSYIQNTDIDLICEKIKPKQFIANLFNYEVTKQEDKLNPIVELTGVTLEKIKTLCDFLLSQTDYKSLLKLQYKAKPQDRPEIKYRVNETDYELIKNVSVGQKCTAMLIMTLSDGVFPVIIDQPEDSLDVRSVWDDMCLKVRKGKDNRQFIFTTHNSSLAVASDTDKFTIIESDSNTGKIVFSGALDSSEIKEEVITYLEGGKRTYHHKAKKYDL
jgi:hypothetical protein